MTTTEERLSEELRKLITEPPESLRERVFSRWAILMSVGGGSSRPRSRFSMRSRFAVISVAVAVVFACGWGAALAFDRWLKPSDKDRLTPNQTLTVGDVAGVKWSLVSYRGTQGACVELVRSNAVSGACWDKLPLGQPLGEPTSVLIKGPSLAEWIVWGPISTDVAAVKVSLGNDRLVEARTFVTREGPRFFLAILPDSANNGSPTVLALGSIGEQLNSVPVWLSPVPTPSHRPGPGPGEGQPTPGESPSLMR
jgi:hypothetical protein